MSKRKTPALHGGLDDRWEVVAAAVIFIVVLAVIDLAWLRQPSLLLSLAPFLFLLLAAVTPLTPRRLGGWVGGFILLALATGNWSYLGLTLPVLIVAALLRARRHVRASE